MRVEINVTLSNQLCSKADYYCGKPYSAGGRSPQENITAFHEGSLVGGRVAKNQHIVCLCIIFDLNI
jgi:hypothetical protein